MKLDIPLKLPTVQTKRPIDMETLIESNLFTLTRYPFPLPSETSTSDKGANKAIQMPLHTRSWPVLYILSNERANSVYIGETTNYRRRMGEHKGSADKDFDKTLLIDSPTFNQSTTFDYERRLIELFIADKKYHVTNKNNGHYAFNYYQRAQYRQDFRKLWEDLRRTKYANHPIEEIENTDLYKYSPFKGLTEDQYEAIEHILKRIKNDPGKSCTFINGLPGTGKSILAITLLFKLRTDPEYENLKVALVCYMDDLRTTYRTVARSVEGLKPGDIIGPSDVANKGPYDVLLVDEAHRMTTSKGVQSVPAYRATCDKLGLSHEASQWDWMVKASNTTIFFFDPKQRVRATGLGIQQREALLEKLSKQNIQTDTLYLSTQMRVQGGDEYLDFVYDILNAGPTAVFIAKHFDELFSPYPYSHNQTQRDLSDSIPLYEFAIIDSFHDFCSLQEEKERECGLSRMAAGYAWKWATKHDPTAFDIEIEGIKKRWNSKGKGNWVNSPEAVNEVGSIHTVQGFDLNYGFIIIGDDIQYDVNNDCLKADKRSSKDTGAKRTSTDTTLREVITNAYYVLLTRGVRGTFLYICNPKVKQYFQRFVPTISQINGEFHVVRKADYQS